MTSDWSVSGVDEIIAAFGGAECVEERSDAPPSCLVISLCRFAHEVLEFGEDLLDRIEIGAVGRQEQEPGSGATDRLSNGRPFVAAQIVHRPFHVVEFVGQ